MEFIQVIHRFHYEPDDILVVDEYKWININTITTIGSSGFDNPKSSIWVVSGNNYYRKEAPYEIVLIVEELAANDQN